MVPLPVDDNALSTAVHAVVGGSKAALSWPTILAFTSILIAAMQGTLVMESAEPCRISYRKVCILLGLEVAEVVVIVASEALSFVQLRRALTMRLEWLKFVAPCILVIGLSETLLDVLYKLICAEECRIKWIPFSASGRNADGSERQHWEILWLIVTACCSLVLVGWRQRWWWVSAAVSADVAKRASEESKALSVGVMGFSVGCGLMISVGISVFVCTGIVAGNRYGDGMFYLLRPIRFEEKRLADESTDFSEIFHEMARARTPQLKSQQRLVERLRQGEHNDEHAAIDDDAMDWQLTYAPVHVGNAIVGEDKHAIYQEDDGDTALAHVIFLLMEHLSILPFLVSVLVAVVQLWNKMDTHTFSAVKELVDVANVVAFVEIAIGLKSLLWGVRGSGDDKADIAITDDSRWIQKAVDKRREMRQQDNALADGEGHGERTRLKIFQNAEAFFEKVRL